jgi:CRP-like cAMP-binding protein
MIPRIATATVTQPSVVLEIPGEVFSGMLSDNPEVKNTFIKRSKTLVVETTLRCAPIFNNLDTQSFSELCYISTNIAAKKDDVICHEGTMEKSMYVIGSGTARAYITIDGKEITIALLRPGDYFGEYSIFTGGSRCASVSALTDMQLVLLEGEVFESFIDYNEDTDEKISHQTHDRKNSLDHIRHDSDERQAVESRLNQIQERLGL